MDPIRAVVPLSLARLYLLRAGYLVFAVGLVVTKWPLLIGHDLDWPLFEGVETSILVAFSLLALVGLRHPVAMLPLLVLECLWKLIWLAAVALPLWVADRIDPATATVVLSFVWVLIIVAAVPWDLVVSRYVTGPGDRWRDDRLPPPTGSATTARRDEVVT